MQFNHILIFCNYFNKHKISSSLYFILNLSLISITMKNFSWFWDHVYCKLKSSFSKKHSTFQIYSHQPLVFRINSLGATVNLVGVYSPCVTKENTLAPSQSQTLFLMLIKGCINKIIVLVHFYLKESLQISNLISIYPSLCRHLTSNDRTAPQRHRGHREQLQPFSHCIPNSDR